MEDFKRPDHSDFMTSSELKKIEFSGMRENKITRATELWVLGEIVKQATYEDKKVNPHIVEQMHIEYFGLPRNAD